MWDDCRVWGPGHRTSCLSAMHCSDAGLNIGLPETLKSWTIPSGLAQRPAGRLGAIECGLALQMMFGAPPLPSGIKGHCSSPCKAAGSNPEEKVPSMHACPDVSSLAQLSKPADVAAPLPEAEVCRYRQPQQPQHLKLQMLPGRSPCLKACQLLPRQLRLQLQSGPCQDGSSRQWWLAWPWCSPSTRAPSLAPPTLSRCVT